MNLEANTIAQMSAAEKTEFMAAFASGNMAKAAEIIKANMQQAVDKEARMARNLTCNPRNLAAFSGIVLDMMGEAA
tara:strand:+ start:207 stop:434 length:228 start_codon:yes stop_codon:yes gene_type:complete